MRSARDRVPDHPVRHGERRRARPRRRGVAGGGPRHSRGPRRPAGRAPHPDPPRARAHGPSLRRQSVASHRAPPARGSGEHLRRAARRRAGGAERVPRRARAARAERTTAGHPGPHPGADRDAPGGAPGRLQRGAGRPGLGGRGPLSRARYQGDRHGGDSRGRADGSGVRRRCGHRPGQRGRRPPLDVGEAAELGPRQRRDPGTGASDRGCGVGARGGRGWHRGRPWAGGGTRPRGGGHPPRDPLRGHAGLDGAGVLEEVVARAGGGQHDVDRCLLGTVAARAPQRLHRGLPGSGAPVLPPLLQTRAAQDVVEEARRRGDGDYFPLLAGQGVGLVHNLPGAAEVVEAIVREARVVLAALPRRARTA